MAITDSATAGAVNTLARWLLRHPLTGRSLPGEQEARGALALLANAAHKHIMAGLTGPTVVELWPNAHQQEIAPKVAHHVLWHYGASGGREPGSFISALMEAIARADPINRRHLSTAFPSYVAACELAESRPNGIDTLAELAAAGKAAEPPAAFTDALRVVTPGEET